VTVQFRRHLRETASVAFLRKRAKGPEAWAVFVRLTASENLMGSSPCHGGLHGTAEPQPKADVQYGAQFKVSDVSLSFADVPLHLGWASSRSLRDRTRSASENCGSFCSVLRASCSFSIHFVYSGKMFAFQGSRSTLRFSQSCPKSICLREYATPPPLG
jgi:hypothetical protein